MVPWFGTRRHLDLAVGLVGNLAELFDQVAVVGERGGEFTSAAAPHQGHLEHLGSGIQLVEQVEQLEDLTRISADPEKRPEGPGDVSWPAGDPLGGHLPVHTTDRVGPGVLESEAEMRMGIQHLEGIGGWAAVLRNIGRQVSGLVQVRPRHSNPPSGKAR